MRPTKLSSQVFLELPPVLAHYVEAERNLWVEGNPRRGRFNLLNRSGNFIDIESMAVERRHLLQLLGLERLRALRYRTGFEQGRRDGARHFQAFAENARLALQAALVFGQVQGRFVAEPVKFEFDLENRTLFRDVILRASVEGVLHRMSAPDHHECACWTTAGYLSGHVSEIVGRRVVTLEVECVCNGAEQCRFISRLDSEWGHEVDWARAAMKPATIDMELRAGKAEIQSAQEEAAKAQDSLSDLNKRVSPDLMIDSIVADSESMAPVRLRARQLMSSDAPVLVVGESGTGKETLARSIHYGGARKTQPFITVDCAGLNGDLLNQELLGFVEGAVPGISRGHTGAYARANGGTLYLNDVTALSPEAQGMLMRTMNNGEVTPIGADAPIPTNIRVIAASPEDPIEAVEEGMLREDLYYALAIGRIDLPALRERRTDIIRLAEAFLQEYADRHGRGTVRMTLEFKSILLDCAWPGNLRQLRNVMEHAVIMAQGGELTPNDLPEEVLATRWTKQPGQLTEEVIRAALKRTHNNRSRAADLLGVGRTTLWRAMKRLDVA